MLTADVILRCIAALLEAQVVILQKASTEQVQAWIDWSMKKIDRFDRLLDRVLPDFNKSKTDVG